MEEQNNTRKKDTEDEKRESLYIRIMEMPVSERIKLAATGSRDARNILIKDVNKIVIQAVINSPKMTEDDAVSYASNRNLPAEVTKLIAAKREFVKNYQIKLALVSNPKTPAHISLKLLNHIREKDLRNLSRSKNIPAVISRAALKLLSKKSK